jgi:hypothetical protein
LLLVSVVLPRQSSLPAFAEGGFTPDKASFNVRVALQHLRRVFADNAL